LACMNVWKTVYGDKGDVPAAPPAGCTQLGARPCVIDQYQLMVRHLSDRGELLMTDKNARKRAAHSAPSLARDSGSTGGAEGASEGGAADPSHDASSSESETETETDSRAEKSSELPSSQLSGRMRVGGGGGLQAHAIGSEP
jgi:hypothetical protein